MRLLSTQTWDMKEFIPDEDTPPYAILSHTWGDGEISYQQWENRRSEDIKQLKGFKKIVDFGIKAAEHGHSWVWVDTCCIDKKSSAELSEAINAMYRWYRSASVCYVYLADVSSSTSDSPLYVEMPKSRWFSRGWTLQELIAPLQLQFYTSEWDLLGTKHDRVDLLCSITGIDTRILLGAESPSEISIARRMSWASRRQTSRVEDMAYCLLGLFDVNIPLIYGEGKRAFRRLQQAIMDSTTHDQSLFAWGMAVVPQRVAVANLIDADQSDGLKPIPWKSAKDRPPLLGLLAESPADFVNSGDIGPVDHGYMHVLSRKTQPRVLNGGILLDLILYKRYVSVLHWDGLSRVPPTGATGGGAGGRALEQLEGITQPTEASLVVMLCRFSTEGSKLVGLLIHNWGDGFSSRSTELVAVDDGVYVSQYRFEKWRRTMHVMPFQPFKLRHRDIVVRRMRTSYLQREVRRPLVRSGPAWRMRWGDRVLRLEKEARGDEEITFFFQEPGNEGGVAIALKRVILQDDETKKATAGDDGIVQQHHDIGCLWVGVSGFVNNGSMSTDGRILNDMEPVDGRPFHEPEVQHIMRTPTDAWACVTSGWPGIFLRVERVLLEGRQGETVDVIDLFVYADKESVRRAKLSISQQ